MFTFCLLEFLDCLRTSKTCLVYAIPIKETLEGLPFLIVMYSICTPFLDANNGLPNHFPPKYVLCHLEERIVKWKYRNKIFQSNKTIPAAENNKEKPIKQYEK